MMHKNWPKYSYSAWGGYTFLLPASLQFQIRVNHLLPLSNKDAGWKSYTCYFRLEVPVCSLSRSERCRICNCGEGSLVFLFSSVWCQMKMDLYSWLKLCCKDWNQQKHHMQTQDHNKPTPHKHPPPHPNRHSKRHHMKKWRLDHCD